MTVLSMVTARKNTHCRAFDSSQSQSSPKMPDTSPYSDATPAARPIDIGLIIKPGMSVKDVSTAVTVLSRGEKYKLLLKF